MLIIFANSYILDVWQGSEYAFGGCYMSLLKQSFTLLKQFFISSSTRLWEYLETHCCSSSNLLKDGLGQRCFQGSFSSFHNSFWFDYFFTATSNRGLRSTFSKSRICLMVNKLQIMESSPSLYNLIASNLYV